MNIAPEIIQQASQLQLMAKQKVSTLLSGNYRSAFRGSGMQFKEFRRYEPGDDIRHMSWSVTARTGRPTIKVFEEDRELNILLLIDVSGSSLFGEVEKRKIDMYAELLALLGLAAIKSQDRIGMLFFNDQTQTYLPPKDSLSHLMNGMVTLLQQPLKGAKSDLRPALQYASSLLKNKSLVIVVSDFFLPSFEFELRMLTRRHELILLHSYHDAERGFGLSGVYEVWDPETEQFYLLDGSSRETKNVLAQNHQHIRSWLEDLSHRCGAGYQSLSVQDDYLQRLVQFFRRRGPARL